MLFFLCFPPKHATFFPRWQAVGIGDGNLCSRDGAVLQDSVAELEMDRAAGQQTENAFVPSSYEAKELY